MDQAKSRKQERAKLIEARREAALTQREREIIQRIIVLRNRCYGRRGRAAFSKALGIKPSTYHPYEINRVPPAETLLQMAEATGTDVRWLLTGVDDFGVNANAGYDPLISRLSRLVHTHPAAAECVRSYLDVLEKSFVSAGRSAKPQAPSSNLDEPTMLIPVIARAAIGLPGGWIWPLQETWTIPPDIRAPGVVSSTVAADYAEMRYADELSTLALKMVNLPQPMPISGLHVEQALLAYGAPETLRPMMAIRMDGASMAPSIRHGDLVLFSTRRPLRPAELRPAGEIVLLQIRSQPGITVRLAVHDSGGLRLIALGDPTREQRITIDQIEWGFVAIAAVPLIR